jgi:formyl-CoA transferase
MPGPLQGVRVVEFTEIIAGPLAGMLLADMGADVVKVEPPWGDPWRHTQPFTDTESRPFLAYNRGKRSLTLDLTTPEAQEVIHRLIPQMDVALVNYRPDVAAKLGVDYDTLAALNSRLVYCENTSFGRQGPDAHRPGYDLIVQAMSGMMAAEEKFQDGVLQPLWSTPLIDTTAGICLAWSVCGALYSRERTGQGQKVETTLLGMALALLGMRLVQVDSLDREDWARTLESLRAMREADLPQSQVMELYQAGHAPAPGGIYYRTYETQDGAIAVGCLNNRLRQRLLETLGLTDIRFEPDYDPTTPEAIDFGHNLTRQAEELFLTKTSSQWSAILESNGIPCGPVRFVEELFDDPQVQANSLMAELEHAEVGKVRMVGPMAHFSETPLELSPSPALGQHTDAVLRELGYSAPEIDHWRQKGIIR